MPLLLPKAYKNIQVNYCVSSLCENFGLSDPHLYKQFNNEQGLNVYLCQKCGSYPQFIDNKPIYETMLEQQKHHFAYTLACPNKNCYQHQQSVHIFPSLYNYFGKTRTGKQRYLCKQCKTVFTDQLVYANDKGNLQVNMFNSLKKGNGIRQTCKDLTISAKLFYKYQRDMSKRLQYVAHVNEQYFYANKAQENLLTSFKFMDIKGSFLIASSEAKSGYIIAFDSNFTEQSLNPDTLFNVEPKTQAGHSKEKQHSENIVNNVLAQYDEIMKRANFLKPLYTGETLESRFKINLIQPYLTCFSHALFVKSKLHNKPANHFYVKQDTMLRNAFIHASLDDLINEKDQLFYSAQCPVEFQNFKSEQVKISHLGWWQDKWGFLSTTGNTLGACHIKGKILDKQQWQNVLLNSSLQGVEQYLKLISDFLIGLQSLNSVSSIYDWLHIFTGYYNFCCMDENGKTPAQKLGLMDAPISLQALLDDTFNYV